ncbi:MULTISPECIES: NADP-dependent oxidoreductase [Bacillus]|nr:MULTISPECIES: NADP-dependent oxidoreductase [Bacillus]MBV7321172.1 NADP-dependent oxidoreductase [Halalkalibacterium halodurans]MCP9301198.1 NADP-dependent oxidoreductase [Bacillus halotolerans]MCV0026729.1 NADP-dependent oxidoreductase [Bacillus sp. XT-2]PRS07401.1 NADP-dependent oxidoreductase [Bacillus halotolerans]PRS25150.1 NADP-dependent oxidoreductase [Bacillus halotolerans]
MKAVQIHSYSKKLEAHINDVPIPRINKHQVLIKTNVAGVDPHLILAITGKVRVFDHYDFPLTLGNELSGVIETVGEAVTDFNKGDRVYALMPLDTMGAFAEYVVADANIVAKLPKHLTFEEGAAIPLSALTVVQAFDVLNVKPGAKLFIPGGTGGFGQIAIPFAKSKKLFVAVSGSETARHLALSIGADQFIDYQKQDYVEVLKDFDYVIDTRGASEFRHELRVLKPGGKLLSLNAGPNTRFAIQHGGFSTLQRLLFGMIGMPFDIAAHLQRKTYDFLYVQPNGKQLKNITQWIDEAGIKPTIDSTFAFRQVNEAIAKIAKGKAQGKILLIIQE